MKRKNAILLILALLVLAGASYQLFKRTSLDFSDDEEPFRSMAMPLKEVAGNSYMDGGSVSLHVTDANGRKYEITFPIDHYSRDSHPTAFQGNIEDWGSALALRNPARAKAIAIQLLKDHPFPVTDPKIDLGVDDVNEYVRRILSPPPSDVIAQIGRKIVNFLDGP
ncbi:MAG: hypothetical protein EOP85_04025 [Verrucomicrobiaceae bacterium]|nr:MAG: hypothetical protein EOP85_04025 [Verrucomicrobiaceae bacterium]